MASIIHLDDGWQGIAGKYALSHRRLGIFDWRYIIAKGNIIEGIEAET